MHMEPRAIFKHNRSPSMCLRHIEGLIAIKDNEIAEVPQPGADELYKVI